MKGLKRPTYASDLQSCDAIAERLRDSDQYERVGAQIGRTYNRHALTMPFSDSYTHATQSLQAQIDSRWPGRGLKLTAFGSVFTGLATKSSDLDLVLLDPSRPYGRWTSPEDGHPLTHGKNAPRVERLPNWYDIYELADALRPSIFVSSTESVPANVPFVRVNLIGDLGSIDVIVNNSFSMFNSRLVRAYVSLRPTTLRQLVFAVKYWFDKRGLNDSSGRKTGMYSFSSYAIVLLVIQYLQCHWNLPNLQDHQLVARLPRTLSYQWRRDGYEKRKQTSVKRSAIPGNVSYDDGVTSLWSINFADPHGRDSTDLDVVDRDGVRAIVTPGYFERTRHPNNLHSWMHNYKSLEGQPIWRDLPHPDGVGLYRPESGSADEVGSLFMGFITWLNQFVQEPSNACSHIIDISNAVMRPIGADDPLEWQREGLIIADPFIKHRNVAWAIKGPTMERFRMEVQRAVRFQKVFGIRFDFIRLATPRRDLNVLYL